MSLQTRLGDFITAVGTDYKQLRIWITGTSTGDLTGLNTTVKTSLVAAINEVDAAATGAPPAATETVAGVAEVATTTEITTGTDDGRMVTPLKLAQRLAGLTYANASEIIVGLGEIATQAETTTGSDDFRWITPLKLQQKLTAWAQPLNTNLTNLAGITNTAYGRALLALANQAALTAAIANASETLPGISEIATTAEVTTGTDDVRQITPLKLQQRLAAVTIPLTYLDTDVNLAANSDAKVATQKAVKAYADGLLDANNAYVYKGVVDASTNPNYPAASAGHTYKISVAGKIGGAAGAPVEAGDTITCIVDSTASGTQATVGSNWIVIQTNIDGAFVGPASSTTGNFVSFAGTTGKVGADSGISLDTDAAMGANSNTKVPSQAAVRSYVAAAAYTKAELGNPETDLVAAYTAAKA
jgi:hypothetical protein